MSRPAVSIIVPVFRGESTLVELTQRIADALTKHSLEFIFVHDGGTEASWQTMKSIYGNKRPENLIRIIKLGKNYGQNAATQCGLNHSTGELVITIDEDLETPPETITALIEKQKETQAEVVFGKLNADGYSAFRKWGTQLIKRFFWSIEGLDIGSSFRLMTRGLIDRLNHPPTEHLFINQVVHCYTDRIAYVEIEKTIQPKTTSSYRIGELFKIALRLVFFYSDFLLRVMIYIGILVSLICLGFATYFMYERIIQGTSFDYTAIIVAIFLSTGVLMTCLSVIGLYIKRIFKGQLGRPVYAIQEMMQ